jgi:hypothetical protein
MNRVWLAIQIAAAALGVYVGVQLFAWITL